MSEIFRLIKCHRGKDKSLILWGKTSEGDKVAFEINDFNPYFYVLEDESVDDDDIVDCEWGFTSIHGEKVRKLIVKLPEDVPIIRESVSKHFEADIPFPRRFCIDKQIRSHFKVIKIGDQWDFIGDDSPLWEES